MEHCRLSEDIQGVRLDGSVLVGSGDVPWRLEYEIRTDAAWRTRAVSVRGCAGTQSHSLELAADERGRWMVAGKPREDLDGCLDVDLGFSPSTDTLPIRRLRLNEREQATIHAAWVQFPSLSVQRVPQQYTRVADRVYHYENLSTGFAARMDVDASGLVVSYPPGWEQLVASAPSTSPLCSRASFPALREADALYDPLR